MNLVDAATMVLPRVKTLDGCEAAIMKSLKYLLPEEYGDKLLL